MFNNQIPTAQGNFYRTIDPPGYPDTLYDLEPQLNPNYGRIQTRQDPRLFRLALRISF
jgi:hypothetical protein